MAETCKDKVCPELSGPVVKDGQVVLHEQKCIEHRCAHYQQILGNDPQTDAPLGYWDCAFNWATILTIETSKEVRQGAAAVESARNEAVRTGGLLAGGLAALIETAARTPGGRVEEVIDDRAQACQVFYLEQKK